METKNTCSASEARTAVNMAVLYRVPASAKRLLDLASGTGTLGRELDEVTDRKVFGVTYSKEKAALAARKITIF
jgi:cyclopropane fatty-acyl-phospholipid synthase-like methyltransferase